MIAFGFLCLKTVPGGNRTKDIVFDKIWLQKENLVKSFFHLFVRMLAFSPSLKEKGPNFLFRRHEMMPQVLDRLFSAVLLQKR